MSKKEMLQEFCNQTEKEFECWSKEPSKIDLVINSNVNQEISSVTIHFNHICIFKEIYSPKNRDTVEVIEEEISGKVLAQIFKIGIMTCKTNLDKLK